MSTKAEEPQEERTITILNGPGIKKGDFVKFRNESDGIVYGVISKIDEGVVWVIVGTDLNGADVDTYEIGDFNDRFMEFLFPAEVVEKLNRVHQAII